MDQPSWISSHIQRWEKKPQLRYFYENEIFRRIFHFLEKKNIVVEIGSGPGFLKSIMPQIISTDIDASPTINCQLDASQLPFKEGHIDAYVGVDVLHHFDHPGCFFQSAAHSLKTGGRIILVEPWAGYLGYFFYRFIHHEECKRVQTPFGPAFSGNKSSMDGNAMIARQCLVESESQLTDYGFKTVHKYFFGSLSYLLTGGFKPYAAPFWLVKLFLNIERTFPQPFMRFIGMRTIIVLEKI